MTKFLELFSPIIKGNFGLTDEAIYRSIHYGGQFIPVYGGTEEHLADRFISEYGKTKHGEPITIFNDDGIIISLDGSSGFMTYLKPHRFALNHHAGFFTLLDDSKQMIIPEFFSLFYEKPLQEASVSEGSKTLTLDKIYSIDFDIPAYNIQQNIMERICPILILKKKIEILITKINTTLGKNPVVKSDDNQSIVLSDILKYISRNDSLSEKGIYEKSFEVNKSKAKIKVISGSIDGFYGYYPIDNKIHMVRNKCCLQVVIYGQACSMRFLEKGTYATNNNSMLLILKDEIKEKLNVKNEADEELYLRFLEFYLYPFFKEFSSSADLGVFPLTKAIDKISIPLMKLDDEIKLVAQQYRKLKHYLNQLNESLLRIEGVFRKSIYLDT